MGQIITTAGKLAAFVPEPSPRREAIKHIRSILRKQGATDDEVDDALEALAELARSEE